jgi:hypothetical protein
VSNCSIRALLVFASATTLIATAACAIVFTTAASALPCTDCGGDPVPDPDPEPTPVITTARQTFTLSVSTARGRVTDGSGIDCPAGACSRNITYSVRCTDGNCPAYTYSTVTLTLTPADGYSATWDGCTPHANDPTLCDVLVDSDRAVSVAWTASADGDPVVNPTPVHDGGAVAPHPSGGGVGGATRVGGTVETGVADARPGTPGAIRSSIRYSFRRSATWTEFTLFKLRHLPAGATVRATCRGARCPEDVAAASRRRTMKLPRLTGRRFGVGTVIKVAVSKPGKRTRTTRIEIRRDKDPLITHPR